VKRNGIQQRGLPVSDHQDGIPDLFLRNSQELGSSKQGNMVFNKMLNKNARLVPVKESPVINEIVIQKKDGRNTLALQ